MHTHTALILAGGLGTRLRAVVADVPKPMAPVAGVPFLAHLMRYWMGQGITRFVLSVGYKGEVVRDYFGASFEGADVVYVEEPEPLGTGGGVRHALTADVWTEPHCLLLNGDTWFEADFAQLQRDASPHTCPITLTLAEVEDGSRYGGVVVGNDGRVTQFESGGSGKKRINVGCYLLNRDALAKTLADYPPKFSFEEDVLKPFAPRGWIAASVQQRRFLDIGIPEDYARAAVFLGLA